MGIVTVHAENPLVEASRQFDQLLARREQLKANLEAEKQRQEKLKREQRELAEIEQEILLVEYQQSGRMSLTDFAKKHGTPIFVKGAGWLFEDGSRHPGGFDFADDPPADKFQLARVRRVYLNARIQQEAETFANYRERLLEQLANCAECGNNVPMPPEDAGEKLNILKDRVEKTKADLAEVNAILADSPEAKVQRERQRLADETAQELERRRRAIMSVNL